MGGEARGGGEEISIHGFKLVASPMRLTPRHATVKTETKSKKPTFKTKTKISTLKTNTQIKISNP